MFKPGQSGNPAGRAKGVPTKATLRFKDALNNLLEQSADEMIGWLGEISDPKARFDVLKDFAEYIHPKLARSEQIHTGPNGGAVQHQMNVYINGVKPDDQPKD